MSNEEQTKLTNLLATLLSKIDKLEKDIEDLKAKPVEHNLKETAVLHTLVSAQERENEKVIDLLNSPLLNKTADAIIECKKRGIYDQSS